MNGYIQPANNNYKFWQITLPTYLSYSMSIDCHRFGFNAGSTESIAGDMITLLLMM